MQWGWRESGGHYQLGTTTVDNDRADLTNTWRRGLKLLARLRRCNLQAYLVGFKGSRRYIFLHARGARKMKDALAALTRSLESLIKASRACKWARWIKSCRGAPNDMHELAGSRQAGKVWRRRVLRLTLATPRRAGQRAP